ncbi:MAG: hypothetical protein A3G76_10775 [Acidobacteria bacterium RIFCSPLOWO2_12_FULL_65_11]|nr:MAG: hypothetical protein A3H95_00230 [Acidobacteria bacterium RIFCSPLOWO2_02_FULL_64_15]OFW29685.1 MAG: hypothetical protein A3G76_10775 [Acidobacteria bacterium RIFCSPLOWO2_12_FULL_65_11]
MEILASLEQSAFSAWVRESGSLWAYPGILFMHTIGLGLLVGASTAIDLRILGVASRVSLAPMERFLPIMWIGFWINAVSGSILLVADASTKLTNPAFAVKMGCIALAVVDIFLIRRYVFRDPGLDRGSVSPIGKTLAAMSLLFWTAAMTAGRLMAYIGQDSGAPEFFNRIGG